MHNNLHIIIKKDFIRDTLSQMSPLVFTSCFLVFRF
jgi:hypothetical protein